MDAGTDKAELRKFGLALAGFIAAIFGVIVPWLFGLGYALWPWVLAAVVVVVSLFASSLLAPVQKILLRVGEPIGRFNAFVLLSAVFFLLVCPMGLLMRLFGRDPMHRSFEPDVDTYRKKSEPASSMEVPF